MVRYTTARPYLSGKAGEADAARDRFEEDAEKILEQIFCRRNWTAVTRDALAKRLEEIVAREAKAARKGEKS